QAGAEGPQGDRAVRWFGAHSTGRSAVIAGVRQAGTHLRASEAHGGPGRCTHHRTPADGATEAACETNGGDPAATADSPAQSTAETDRTANATRIVRSREASPVDSGDHRRSRRGRRRARPGTCPRADAGAVGATDHNAHARAAFRRGRAHPAMA